MGRRMVVSRHHLHAVSDTGAVTGEPVELDPEDLESAETVNDRLLLEQARRRIVEQTAPPSD